MCEANHAAWKAARQAEREAARPASWIEVKILNAHMAANGDRQKFEAALAEQGLGLARTTEADVAALDVLRKDEELKAAINADPKSKDASVDHLGIVHRPDAVKQDYIKYFPEIEAGQFAAVDRFGGVHRLNQHHLKDIAQQLDAPQPNSVARLDQPAWTPLPGIVDLRAGFESERELKDKFFTAIKEGSKRDRQDT
jgi:hypothetical protein